MNKELFSNILKELKVELTDQQYSKLEKYSAFLQEYNRHTNLTAIKEEQDIYIKHFYDSLTLCRIIDLRKINNLLDIGTGAGFPGIVLKIFYPNLKITLLDSNNKKTKFLTELVNILELNNVEIINSRAEDFVKKRLNAYDLVTARAVANLRVLSEISLPFVRECGYFVAMKSSVEEELNEARLTILTLSADVVDVKTLYLPNNNGKRTLISIKKIKPTLKSQLRPYNKILKIPLK